MQTLNFAFYSASVRIPPGEFDIYTFPQLHDSLAQLITDNLEVRTWLFKMDHEFDGKLSALLFLAKLLQIGTGLCTACNTHLPLKNFKNLLYTIVTAIV